MGSHMDLIGAYLRYRRIWCRNRNLGKSSQHGILQDLSRDLREMIAAGNRPGIGEIESEVARLKADVSVIEAAIDSFIDWKSGPERDGLIGAFLGFREVFARNRQDRERLRDYYRLRELTREARAKLNAGVQLDKAELAEEATRIGVDSDAFSELANEFERWRIRFCRQLGGLKDPDYWKDSVKTYVDENGVERLLFRNR